VKALALHPEREIEKVFLAGLETRERASWDLRDSMDELAQLAATAGGRVVGQGIQKLDRPVAATFFGSGKAAEWALHCEELGADTIIVDDDLSAAQSRNLERVFQRKVLDRTSLILDIFAQRARTREGKLQVELAILEHLLPRLTRYWEHLSRQKGGIGMRGGEGETQLEADRRKVQERIVRIGKELEQVRRQRGTQRQGRRRHQWPLASLVGYTNAGKSTLFNSLTGAGVLVEDKLFATLDPTIRRLVLPTRQSVLLSDTVGFIRNLPHRLVEAFKATLEEVVQADLLLHVVDASNPRVEDQIRAVHDVLEEIGAGGKPTLTVLNKVDRFSDRAAIENMLDRCPRAVAVSARTGEGFDALRAEIGGLLRPIRRWIDLEIPHEASGVIAQLHASGEVIAADYSGPRARLQARVPPHLVWQFEPFIVGAS